MTTKTMNDVINKIMRQRNDKTLTYEGDKYVGAEVTSVCMFKLEDLIINRLSDNMFDVETLVMQNALPNYQIMTIRDYRLKYGDNDAANLDLNMYIDVNKTNGKTKSFDDGDVKLVCQYLRKNYGHQLD